MASAFMLFRQMGLRHLPVVDSDGDLCARLTAWAYDCTAMQHTIPAFDQGEMTPNGTLWLFNIAMENGPFIDGLPIKNGDFPWLC